MHFRINMIGMTRQDNSRTSGFRQVLQRFFAHLPYIGTKTIHFQISAAHRFFNLAVRQVQKRQFFLQPLSQAFRIIQRQERLHQPHAFCFQHIHVIAHNFRITSHDRTVIMIVRICKFLTLHRNARIKNERRSLMGQIHNMPMHQLSRIANRLGWNGL